MIITKVRSKGLNLTTLFVWFIIYSYIGWIYETLYCSIHTGRYVDRGFMYGPVIPIYGICIVMMIVLCSNRFKSNVTLFLSCAIVASILEYMTSLWMELVYGRRWWDYSDQFLNINGRVCLGAAMIFGLSGVLIIRYLHPSIVRYMNDNISPAIVKNSSKVVMAVFVIDTVLSLKLSFH